MGKYNELMKAIDDKNIPLIRSMIIGYANQSASVAMEAIEHVKSKIPSIFVPHDGNLYPINHSRSAWNEDYWHGLTSDMMHNFSVERVNHLLEVAKVLQPKPEKIKSKELILDVKLKIKLDKLLQEGSLDRLRSEIVGLANINIQDALRAFIYAIDRKPEIMQNHDENLYPIDRNNKSWDNNYWHRLTSDLMHNFSKERFEHAFQVATHLNLNNGHVDKFKPKKETNSEHPNHEQFNRNNVLIYILIAAGIVIAIPLALWIILKS
ncbi:MAG: hypothetical protein PHR06_02415 [Candidatus Cloacimonetes bacterium]|nr:hypothetical protein [Candidatus Cloacimonadota bacterium]